MCINIHHRYKNNSIGLLWGSVTSIKTIVVAIIEYTYNDISFFLLHHPCAVIYMRSTSFENESHSVHSAVDHVNVFAHV